jgi:hypothetical protein
LCFLVFLAGCSGPESVPSGVIPRDKMQQILWDMVEADQYSQLYLARDSARIDVKAETAGRYEQVFQLYKISKDQFEKSIHYYFSRPDIAKPLFDSLSAMGVRKRTEDYSHNKPAVVPGHTPVTVPGKAPVPGHAPIPGHAGGPYSPGNNPAVHGLPGHIPGGVPANVPKPVSTARKVPGNVSSKKTPGHKASDTTRHFLRPVPGNAVKPNK